jgi:hypothetical protein
MKYRKRILSQDRRPGKPVGKYQPPPQETPTEVAPQGVTTVFGPLTTRTIATGPVEETSSNSSVIFRVSPATQTTLYHRRGVRRRSRGRRR